jgi:hypothetical protein
MPHDISSSSLRDVGKSVGLFDREVHFKDGEWKKGSFAFFGRIVRALSPEARRAHNEQRSSIGPSSTG